MAAAGARVCIPGLDEVHQLVQRALREGVPIDRLATAAIFPDERPRTWGEWPTAARDAWEGIVAVYVLERRGAAPEMRVPGASGGRPTAYPEVTVERAWEAVLGSWREGGTQCLTWPDLAQRLGVTRRIAQDQLLDRLGFAFRGQGARRELVAGPCRNCGKGFPVRGAEEDSRCGDCRA